MIQRLREIVLPFSVLLVLVTVLFWPFLSRGHIPIPTSYMVSWYEPWKTETTVGGVPTIPHKPVVDDAFRHLYPLRVIASDILKSGQWPLWNPYNGSGTPLLAIMHPGYLTPFGLVFLFLSPHNAWTIYVMLQPVVLGFAMYWYGRKLNLSSRGALLATMTLVLSGFSVVRLEYGEFLYVLAGLPLLLGIVEDIRANPKSYKKYWIPLIVALMIFSGQPHMIVYTLSVFALYTWVRLPWRQMLSFAGLSVLGVGISAVQLIPSLELFSLSAINRQTSEFIFDKFLLPLSHLITVIIPNYFGNQATYNYFGPHDYVETIAYVGSIPVLFALFSARSIKKDAVVRFFSILFVLATLTTMQWAGAKLFFLLPLPVLSADVPSRVFVLVTFALSVLAGIGITAWEKVEGRVRFRWVWIFGALLVLLLAVTYFAYRSQWSCPTVIPQCRMVSLRTTIIELVGFALFALTVLMFRKAQVVRWVPIGIVLVLGLYNAQKFLPFSPRETIFPELPIIARLKDATGLNRFAAVGDAAIRSNLMAMYKLPSTDYFDPLHIRRYAELISYVNTGDRAKGLTRSDIIVSSEATVSGELSFRRERFWDMTGTSALVTKENGDWRVRERKTALPRAYVVQNMIVESEDSQLLSKLFSSETDLASTAFVEKPIEGIQGSGQRAGSAYIDEYSPNRVVLSVEAPQRTSLVVLSDTYYPGWKATVDGVERTIYRTNYTFRGVVVPEGKHEIVFRYQPMSLFIGLWVSGVSAVVWIVFVFWYNKAHGALAKR